MVKYFMLYFSMLLVLVSSVLVITTHRPMRALIYFFIFSFGISGIFFICQSSISGIIEMITYSSAIIVLFIFFVMIMNVESINQTESFFLNSRIWIQILICILSLLIMTYIYYFLINKNIYFPYTYKNTVSIKDIGILLFKNYLLFIQISLNFFLVGFLVSYNLKK